MNTDIKKFEDLLRNDEAFRQKIQTATANYNGEQTEEAIFTDVLSPLAAEYGIRATFDEFKAYIDHVGDREMDSAELSQVAGGTKGLGATACFVIGVGGGGHGQDGRINAICTVIGFGDEIGACAGNGQLE